MNKFIVLALLTALGVYTMVQDESYPIFLSLIIIAIISVAFVGTKKS